MYCTGIPTVIGVFCYFREQCLTLRRVEKDLYLIHKGLDDDEDNEMWATLAWHTVA